MGSRLVAFDLCQSSSSESAQEQAGHSHEHTCCAHDEPAAPVAPVELPCDSDDESPCPVEHHHHHIGCTHVMPLVADLQGRISFSSSACSRMLLNFEHVRAPETPVYEMDKPPLI